MSRNKKVLNFEIEGSEHLISLLDKLTELNIDLDVDSTPTAVEISVYGSEEKVTSASKKIQELVKETKTS